MKFPSQLLEIPSTDPDDRRRSRLLNILLLGVAMLSFLILAGNLAADLSGMETREINTQLLYVGSLIVLGGTAAIFLVNRFWSGQVASALFLILLTMAIAFSDAPRQVVEGRSVFLFTIPILMASVVLRPWASFAMAGMTAAVVTPIAMSVEIVPPLPTIIGFFAFALVSWLSARSLENALEDLRALNRELDQRVEDRTRELRRANTQLARANERLLELDRLKSKFVSMVSHELRTPLGAIQGFAEMLRAGIYGSLSDKQDDALQRVEKNTKKLLNIVNDLLDQARIEAGELSLHPEPFPPELLVEDLESTMGLLAEQKGLSLTVDVDENAPRPVYGDKGRLHQILVNLTNNAIKFTDKGGIHVHIGQADGNHSSHWALEVSDTGPGISEKDRELIFTPFRRVDDSMTREHTGVGLGLSIVKQLVELMDGDITVESELGHGSTFTVVLPLQQD